MKKTVVFLLCFFSGAYCVASEISFDPSVRYRFQQIHDELRGDATASTIKLRLSSNWDMNDYLTVFAEADHVHAFNDNYNSVAINRATSPIPDVTGSEINQFWFQYTGDNNWKLKLGRQSLNIDNERHISSIDFWQNEQSFDALTFQYNDSTSWNLTYSYVNQVNRIFGPEANTILPNNDPRFSINPRRPFLELGQHEHDTHLVNVGYQANNYVKLTGYAYLIDNQSAPQLSSNTFGLRVNGEVKPNDIKYGYTLEYAHQETLDDSPWDFSGHYIFAELSAQYKSHSLAISHEILGEDNGFAFATSLGNNHKFLGWADIFSGYLNTDGIKDTYLTYRGRSAKLRWRAVVHQFASESGSSTIGNELDLEGAYRVNREWQASMLISIYQPKNGLSGLPSAGEKLRSATLSISYNF